MIYDFAIVGAGVFGLALAQRLAQAGHSVILIEAGAIGGDSANASAGLLGALMPPSPLVTGPLAAVQLRCLSRYQGRIVALESETGLPTGYRQAGRIQPILTESALANFTRQQESCVAAWHAFPANDYLRILSHDELDERFPAFAPRLTEAPFGYAVDTISAQVTPRLLLAALAKSIIHSTVTLQPHTLVLRLDGEQIICDGATYRARQTIITAGWQTGALIPAAPVVGVKGQACAVSPIIQNAPLLYTRNGYAVFHAGFTALGSTTEKHWVNTAADPETCDGLRDRMAGLVPALAGLPLTECWAGVRPKATGALPLVARADAQTVIATGGYKVGLALGFEIAGWLTAALQAESAGDFWNFVAAEENLRL